MIWQLSYNVIYMVIYSNYYNMANITILEKKKKNLYSFNYMINIKIFNFLIILTINLIFFL